MPGPATLLRELHRMRVHARDLQEALDRLPRQLRAQQGKMGAREETFHGLAGLGDLITTCVSPEGRNRTVGEQVGKGRKLQEILAHMDSVAEGVPTTRAVRELARRYNVEMPITESVYSVLFDHTDVLNALASLMTREPKPERTMP